jgi:hypothetical protein
MKNKFRASYSNLSLWAKGDYRAAVESYFKLKQFSTKAMVDGRLLHEKWAEEIERTKCMPVIFGGQKLTNPIVELKVVKQIYDWLEIVAIIDMYDDQVLYDWKTGTQTSDTYCRSYQPKVYQVMYPKATRFMIYHYNQHTKSKDVSIVHLTKQTIKDGLNWILTNACDMHNYLETNNLYERFGKK